MIATTLTFSINTRGRGCTDLTPQVGNLLARSGLQEGLVTIFLQHTSASLLLFENADPTARRDLEAWLERLCPDGAPWFTHDLEGPDDMPAHLRMTLTRTSETIPVSGGQLQLGTWQGLFLLEHRTQPHTRRMVATFLGR